MIIEVLTCIYIPAAVLERTFYYINRSSSTIGVEGKSALPGLAYQHGTHGMHGKTLSGRTGHQPACVHDLSTYTIFEHDHLPLDTASTMDFLQVKLKPMTRPAAMIHTDSRLGIARS